MGYRICYGGRDHRAVSVGKKLFLSLGIAVFLIIAGVYAMDDQAGEAVEMICRTVGEIEEKATDGIYAQTVEYCRQRLRESGYDPPTAD